MTTTTEPKLRWRDDIIIKYWVMRRAKFISRCIAIGLLALALVASGAGLEWLVTR